MTPQRETQAPVWKALGMRRWPVRGPALVQTACPGWVGLATGLSRPVAADPAPALRAQARAPAILPVNPRPGAMIAPTSPTAYVAARVEAAALIRRIELRLDGQAGAPEVLGRDERDLSLFYQPRHWEPGRHRVAVTVWVAAGVSACPAWSLRILRPSR